MIVAVLLLVSVGLTGCKTINLYLIDGDDIVAVDKGAVINQPDGSVDSIDRDGWFVSDFYIEEVMKARVGQ